MSKPRLSLRMERLDDRIVPAASTLAYPGIDSHILYTPDDRGDRIPDFSNVGYKSGLTPIPAAPVMITLSPGAGDDTALIQAAIDAVEAMPLDSNGLRGAVLLNAGEYQIGTFLTINASGVVLRGVGDNTVLRATGTDTRAIIQVAGSGSRSTVSGTTHAITDKYVPVGARSFRVDSTSGLAVGHTVIVNRPSTANWIHDTYMDQLDLPWEPGSKDLNFDRVITRIEGNTITLDAPLACALDATYGGGTIKRYTWSNRIENVGIESLKGISDYVSSTDEAHSWDLITLNALQNGWVRNVTSQYFAYSLVSLSDVKWVTVEDCDCLDPISVITGGRRYSFNVNGQLNLVRDCYARNGRHDFVNGSTVEGPNVFVDCRADSAKADTGPHHRWSVGTLFDNVNVQGNQINVQNRGNSGTGHGWAGANMVIWNSTASGGFIVQNPPTAQNWLIGGIGTLKTGTMFVGPTPQVGIVESLGTNVTMRSLYYSQLQERMKSPGLSFREDTFGDMDSFVYDGTTDNPPVDAAWSAAVDAFTPFPLAGFDIGTNKTFIPMTFTIPLAANERIVGATLSIGLRATGTNYASDSIWIDSLTNSKSFASLGWSTSLSTTATTGRVLDLNDQLALLQDGKLNLAIGDDTGVDWATLNVQVAPREVASQDPITPAAIAPAADALVRGGTYASSNFGSDTTIATKLDSSADVNRESFLKFDLSGVAGTVIGAELRFTPTTVGGVVENALSIVNDDSWTESGITWNNKPAAVRRVAMWTPALNQTVAVELTPWVQESLAGDKVLSVKLTSLSNIGGPGFVNYNSREAATLKPQLILTYAMPVGYIVNNGDTQRSRLTTISLSFATTVNAASLSAPGAIRLTRTDGTLVQTAGPNGRILVNPANGTVSALTLTFDGTGGVEHGSLADGRWQLSIPSLGYTSTLNGLPLRRLFGDADANGSVDASDFALFGTAFGGSSVAFDWDGNGAVDASDFAAFGNHFGMTL